MKNKLIKFISDDYELSDKESRDQIESNKSYYIESMIESFDEIHDSQIYLDRNEENLEKIFDIIHQIYELDIEEEL